MATRVSSYSVINTVRPSHALTLTREIKPELSVLVYLVVDSIVSLTINYYFEMMAFLHACRVRARLQTWRVTWEPIHKSRVRRQRVL